MPFLVKEDLTPPLYQEIIDTITRKDDAIVTTAINNAIREMCLYMNRFNTLALFGTATVEPTFEDEYLKSLAKDIAAWHLIKLANPNINLELFRTAYSDAIKTLKAINSGKDADAAWPLREDDPLTPFDESGHIASFSNVKRKNHY